MKPAGATPRHGRPCIARATRMEGFWNPGLSMPIYAYRCTACGHAKDVLQKLSDPVLSVCPACGQASFAKQVTAAGFQLKGSGWYVTDFRDGGGKSGKPAAEGGADKVAAGDKADAGDKSAAQSTEGAAKPAKPAKPAESSAASSESKPAAAPAAPGT